MQLLLTIVGILLPILSQIFWERVDVEEGRLLSAQESIPDHYYAAFEIVKENPSEMMVR
jgi:hypothetical protein